MPLTDRKRPTQKGQPLFCPVFAVNDKNIKYKNSIFPVHFWSNGGGIKKLNFFLSFILYILNFEGSPKIAPLYLERL